MWRALLVLCLLASTADAQPVITWRPPMNCATNDVLKWNGTTWTCSGGAAVTGSGTTNLVAKWTSATGLGNSSITDDGTNITLNPAGGLITLGVGADDTLVGDQLGVRISPGGTAALYVDGSGLTYAANLIGAATINGNTTVTRDDAASHTNRPVLSVTNTSVAGGLNHRADVSFNVADSGGVMRNAVIEAEGQYLFVGAVAGLVSTSPLFQNDGNTVLGNAVGDELDVNGDLSKFGSTSGDGATYINDGTINFQYTTNATASGVINHYGYNAGTTQFRNLIIRDGKGADVVTFTGSDKSTTFAGNLVLGSSGPIVKAGSGTPEASVTAGIGSIYARTNGGVGTELYLKASGAGNTGWETVGVNRYAGKHFEWNDDWLIASQLAQGNGWNGLALGAAPYSLAVNGANSALSPVTGSQRLGVVTLDTGTTATGSAAVSTVSSFAMDSSVIDQISYEWTGGFETLSTVGEEYNAIIGLVGEAPGYGCYFAYDRGNTLAGGPNAGNANKFELWTKEAGTATKVLLDGTTQGGITTVNSAVAAYTFPTTNIYRLKVIYAGSGGTGTSCKGYVNDVLVATITTNLPTHSLGGTVSMTKTAGTTTRKLATDQTQLAVDLNTVRSP